MSNRKGFPKGGIGTRFKTLFPTPFALAGEVGIYPVSLAFIAVLAVFLPWQATRVTVCLLAGSILFFPGAFKRLLRHRSSLFLLCFILCTGLTALVFRNWRGLASTGFCCAIAMVSLYLRDVMTPSFWNSILNFIRICCFFVLVLCAADTARHWKAPLWRCTLWFCNCNYLAVLLAGCVIICAYQVVTNARSKPVSYLLAVGCGIAILFTGSMFAFLEVLIGVSVLLSLTQKHRLLRLFLLICGVGGLLLLLVPQIFPRLQESLATTDNRILIWQDSVLNIPKHWWFGKGFYTYATLPVRYHTAHAHNLILECLLSFGLVGTTFLCTFAFFYYRVVFVCDRLLHKSYISALILAFTAAVLLHSAVDMTMLWTQTALFYGLIMAGIGAEEYTIKKLRATSP